MNWIMHERIDEKCEVRYAYLIGYSYVLFIVINTICGLLTICNRAFL